MYLNDSELLPIFPIQSGTYKAKNSEHNKVDGSTPLSLNLELITDFWVIYKDNQYIVKITELPHIHSLQ